MPTVVARLPAAKRHHFTEPLGPLFTDTESLLEAAGEPIVAIGDVVTAHLGAAGCQPTLSVVDGRTERGPIPEWVQTDRPAAAIERPVENPAGTITAELVDAIEAGLDTSEPTRVVVEGEEDLAVLPAVLLAPTGATVVYGQPGEGMIAAAVDGPTRARCRDRLDLLDHEAEFWASIR
ncbi:hypothetical protein HTSR_1917 [Halodesulfurarchaeum formicicum]|uniref:GTP-dependent dephospho-CoA kinase n=1 Tax=Halodesulfurarchaeum formicicum TaxID=1873524 RepID=A0A1D8S6V6_9EURY|nr:GTP-dependent dephospho-CoA kinase family protein [Halodesulfurarchaeum formicicum]AOW81081.1 hypothetical protein HTSR_1917 [Halodesulfurarchaeum formicicum]APE96417.1 hypothetical protein HSR6_1986 [Halodesulfurarchaeum formicicum]